ncbi:uncharacterized protein LOC132745091 [Ruditapes philippinarum]|uniref:uncharacterized protein LOC132745091 n=1 Tax=Ruditapes philippinarum TaxID=129788 RepID=UPI00295AD46A|nr:uncharacterized protein LOC132745091 [Ruditapes philippinarum]
MWFCNTGTSLMSLILMLILVNIIIRCDASDGTSGIHGESISSKTLIQMGKRLNRPMLTFIGMAMKNLHQCSGWTKWTECGVKILNQFGIRNRSRECIRETSENGKMSEVETDFGLCEGRDNQLMCPKTYNFTSNGFCIKLQVTSKTHDDAEAECNEDGGHLININSDLKYADVKTVLSGFSVIDIIIGGRRKSKTSLWEYTYGINSGYFKWYPGYPRSENSKLCLALENLKWFNLPCNSRWPSLCEIPKK